MRRLILSVAFVLIFCLPVLVGAQTPVEGNAVAPVVIKSEPVTPQVPEGETPIVEPEAKQPIVEEKPIALPKTEAESHPEETAAKDAHGAATHEVPGEHGEAEAHGGGHAAPFKPLEFAAGIVNFIIFMYLLIRFGGKGIASYFKNRAAIQMAAVSEAQALLGEAKAIFDEIKGRKDSLDAEVRDMLDSGKNRATEQAAQIIAAAKSQAERMVEDAKRTIAGEMAKARSDLREHLVNEALAIAEKGVKSGIGAKGQKQLVEQFMSKMEDLQ